MSDEIERWAALGDGATPGPWTIEREELDVDFSDEEQDMAWPEHAGPLQIADHDDHRRVEADVALVTIDRSVREQIVAVVRAAEGSADVPTQHALAALRAALREVL